MTIGGEISPPIAYPDDKDSNNSLYGFHCTDWEESPVQMGPDSISTEESYRRKAHANAYRQYGNPIGWKRYLTLGCYALEDCGEFEKIWKNFDNEPLKMHRIIWYQFMYHVDREIQIPEKLNSWAMHISHAYLEHHDAPSLAMDTFTKWDLIQFSLPTGTAKADDEWIPVVASRRSRNKSPPAPVSTATNSSSQHEKTKIQPGTMHELPLRHPHQNAQSALIKDWSRYQKLVKPASRPPKVSTVLEDDDEDMVPIEEDDMQHISTSTPRSSTLHSPQFPTIAVNDGTHRVTVKWSVHEGTQQYERDNDKLMTAFRNFLTKLFADVDGMFYRWQDDNLGASVSPSRLTTPVLREFMSPTVKFMKLNSQIIFSLRFGFHDNPVVWLSNATTKQFLKENSTEVLISNAKSTSGSIVTAGYILLKAPNTTSTHRYTQFLRSQLPETTPFFDIIRFKRTPMDHLVPHLAVQCGESHVTELCQLFLALLTGKHSALFLPRYAFSVMTEEQVSNQFSAHGKWARSLKPFCLAPVVFHLDQKRTEQFSDGTKIERSTREWAATLTFPDGSPALCDVVNGTSEKKAYLLAPSNFAEHAKELLRQYRLRLSPPSRREARFREKIPDLPDIIHIKTAIQSNVSFMEELLQTNAWTNPLLEDHSRQHERQGTPDPTSQSKQVKNAWSVPPNLSKNSSNSARIQQLDTEDDSAGGNGGNISLGTDERSTASTQSTTLVSESQYHERLRELESATKTKLKALEATSRDSADKLKQLELQLGRLDEMDTKMDMMKDDLKLVSRQLEDSVEFQNGISDGLIALQHNSKKQFEDIGVHLLTTAENVSDLTNAMSEIKAEFVQLSQFMRDLATRQLAQGPNSLPVSHSFPSGGDLSTASDVATQSAPSSSCDNSTGSIQSKKSQASDTSSSGVSAESKASSTTLRSPPPKRTREGIILEQHDPMIVEHDRQPPEEDALSIVTTMDADARILVDTTTVSVNLESRFGAVSSSTLPTTQSPSHIPSPESARLGSSIAQQQSHGTTSSTAHAPLDPQYNHPQSPEGAERK